MQRGAGPRRSGGRRGRTTRCRRGRSPRGGQRTGRRWRLAALGTCAPGGQEVEDAVRPPMLGSYRRRRHGALPLCGADHTSDRAWRGTASQHPRPLPSFSLGARCHRSARSGLASAGAAPPTAAPLPSVRSGRGTQLQVDLRHAPLAVRWSQQATARPVPEGHVAWFGPSCTSFSLVPTRKLVISAIDWTKDRCVRSPKAKPT